MIKGCLAFVCLTLAAVGCGSGGDVSLTTQGATSEEPAAEATAAPPQIAPTQTPTIAPTAVPVLVPFETYCEAANARDEQAFGLDDTAVAATAPDLVQFDAYLAIVHAAAGLAPAELRAPYEVIIAFEPDARLIFAEGEANVTSDRIDFELFLQYQDAYQAVTEYDLLHCLPPPMPDETPFDGVFEIPTIDELLDDGLTQATAECLVRELETNETVRASHPGTWVTDAISACVMVDLTPVP